jgi:hypothetical protein
VSTDIKQTTSETVAGLQIVANQPTTIHAEHGVAVLAAIGTGHLAVDEYSASGVFSARCFWIGWNDAVADGLEGSGFRAGGEEPWAWLHGDRRTAGVRCPGMAINNDSRAGRKAAVRQSVVLANKPLRSPTAP